MLSGLTEEVLSAGRVALGVGKVVPELLDIGVEVVDGGRSDEAVDAHVAVHATPELPGASLDISIADLGTNGLNTAKTAEPVTWVLVGMFGKNLVWGHLPDHKLVVTAGSRVVGISSSEEIVGNVSSDVVALVRPSSSGLHVGDLAHEGLVGDLKTSVGVGLDVVLATGPVPVNVEAGTVAVGPVNVGASGTRAGGLSPAVVVELVSAVGVVAVLVAERLGHSQRGEKPGEDRELHV